MKKALKLLTNKFVITILVFVVWMAFFDQNNWIRQHQRNQELKESEQNIAYLQKEIAIMETEYANIISNPVYLEKFAREKYKMKRDNEDVYVVEK